jgi:hypothetical protein
MEGVVITMTDYCQRPVDYQEPDGYYTGGIGFTYRSDDMTPEGDPPPTEAQQRVVLNAYRRTVNRPDQYGTEFFICPTVGIRGPAAQTAMLVALRRGGWITGEGSPILTDKAKAWASVKLHNEQQAKGK